MVAGTTYYYVVTSVGNTCGTGTVCESPYSNEVAASVPTPRDGDKKKGKHKK